MIQANELRVGNYIQDISGLNLVVVSSISKEEGNIYHIYSSSYTNSESDIRELNGIPLTEAIILSLCDKKIDYKPEYFTDVYEFEYPSDENYGVKVHMHIARCLNKQIHLISYGAIVGRQIKHLHQLQNLYFALTGKELEVKL